MLHLSMRYFTFSEHGLIRFNGLFLNTNLSNLTNLFLTDDRPWSALILIKGFILLEVY
jgi:hypothetical protein